MEWERVCEEMYKQEEKPFSLRSQFKIYTKITNNY